MSQLPETVEQKQGQNEEAGEPGSLIVFDLRKLTQFHEDKPYVQVLSDIGDARLVLFTFKAGQQLKEHQTTSQILVQVLRGRVTFSTVGNSVKLQAGMVLQLEENVPHSVLAQTDAVMLVTMTPSPSFHSLGLGRNNESGQVPLVSRTSR
ncbi:MAG TPA: cupin domain-containing protein [Ktedonobacteraceae bacterium]|nr:cupin domain-containing protein [Ktedonobacteraceae bacterium]